jgi:hypothetical protein
MNSASGTWFGGLDRMAIGLSGLCLAHCVATAVLLTVLGSVGGMLVHPLVHEVGLVLAMIFGALALGRGVLEHGYALPAWVGSLGLGIMLGALTVPHGTMEMTWTLIGVAIVALGHDLNRRAVL